MKKSSVIIGGFLLLALLDSTLAFVNPIDFTYRQVSVIWHLYYIALLVFVRDKPWLTRLLIGMLAGLAADLLFNDSFPACTILYPLFSVLIGFFARWLDELKSAVPIYLLFCFVLDLVPYLGAVIFQGFAVSFLKWFYCMESLSLIIDLLCIFAISYIDIVMVRFFLIEEHRQKKARRKARLNSKHPELDLQ